jgi:hypothetical protein
MASRSRKPFRIINRTLKSPFHRTGRPCSQLLAIRNANHHIEVIAQQGRLAWQKSKGYNLRNYAELAMQCYKRVFGSTMKARALPQQKTEAWISVSALNRMTHLGMPVSVKV